MFLSGDQIRQDLNVLVPVEGDERCVQQVSYDLRVGNEVYLSEERLPTRLSDEHPYVLLPPGQFALIKTLEVVAVPRECVGFISIRSKLKFQGLINVSGFHVDPTYTGHLIFAVQNVGPNDIRLLYRDPAFMMMWALLDSRFSGRKRPPGHSSISLEQMAQLGGSSITLSQLRKEVQTLTVSVRILGALSTAALAAIVILLLERLLQR